jgi:hypothetical protein
VWYEDFGKRSDGTSIPAILTPNPNFFEASSDTILTHFTPLANPGRPNGDYKYASEDIGKQAIEQPVWEPGWNPALRANANDPNSVNQNASANDFYQAVGYVREWTFAEDNKTAIGPFRMEGGESVTFVFVAAAGFRFEGVRDAIRAADWAWERGWDIGTDLPVPAAPEMMVESTADGTALISWTDVDGLEGRPIDGYKIWRASQFQRRDYLEDGLLISDHYHKQHEPGEIPEALHEAVNPYFDGADYAFQGEIQGTYQSEMWGTYELVAKIPKGQAPAAGGGSYDFAFEDENAITGFTYWYYVSAYRDGSWTGPLGPVSSHLESAMAVNVNGRNSPVDTAPGTIGLDMPWNETYPYAWNSPDFPDEGTLEYKNHGAFFTVRPPLANPADVERLISVRPNPYKITGLNDTRTDASSHNINFLNTPADYTLTIIDVSGQIVFRDIVEGATSGSYVWDMFSKDGIEVSSGLYIYHIEYDGGAATGHFAILR